MPPKGSGRGIPLYPLKNKKANPTNNTTQLQSSQRQFDKLTISREVSSTDSFQRTTVSRIVQDVKTAHTVNDIQAIKEDVQGGTFQIKEAEIASKLMLERNSFGDD